MKKEISLSLCHRLIEPGSVVLVSSQYKGRPNVMTASWNVPISHHPPLVGVSINHVHFTHEVVKDGEEFILNIPGPALIEEVNICGTLSGRDMDKFAVAKLAVLQAKRVSPPWIEACLGHLECQVVNTFSLGDHTLFVGEVVSAWADEEAFDGMWLLREEGLCPLHYLGGVSCATLLGQSLKLR